MTFTPRSPLGADGVVGDVGRREMHVTAGLAASLGLSDIRGIAILILAVADEDLKPENIYHYMKSHSQTLI